MHSRCYHYELLHFLVSNFTLVLTECVTIQTCFFNNGLYDVCLGVSVFPSTLRNLRPYHFLDVFLLSLDSFIFLLRWYHFIWTLPWESLITLVLESSESLNLFLLSHVLIGDIIGYSQAIDVVAAKRFAKTVNSKYFFQIFVHIESLEIVLQVIIAVRYEMREENNIFFVFEFVSES